MLGVETPNEADPHGEWLAAYGLPSDISDADLLGHLLALNHERPAVTGDSQEDESMSDAGAEAEGDE